MRVIITENEKNDILKKYIISEEKEYINRVHDKSYDYKFANGKYYYSLKNKNRWIEAKSGSKAELAIKNKVIFNPLTTAQACQTITPNSDITDLKQIIESITKQYGKVDPYKMLNSLLNKYSKIYNEEKIPLRIRCELALLKIRPGYKDKNVFILDTALKLLYLYDRSGKFIAKTEVISGKNKQSTDPVSVAKSLLTWEEQTKSLGFEYVPGKGYVDVTGKNRKYDPEIVYSDTDTSKTRFLPKGVYGTSSTIDSDSEYAGGVDNMLNLTKGNKQLAQAIHGYYIEQPRIEALKKAKEVISKPNDQKVGQEFMDLVLQGSADLSQSYGCINVPTQFLPYLRKYGENSYVFSMGEDKQNYLASNTEEYFEKMTNSQYCPSPASLGVVPVSDMA